MMKRSTVILLGAGFLVAAAAGLAAYHQLAPRRTPSGQPPLRALTDPNLTDLRAAFNADPGIVRVLALLSPT